MQSAPNRIGKYELLSRLGRGGMGEVYKAFHPQLQRYVAIKVLLTTSETDPEFITRFQREAMAVAQLRHPHIVQVFDFDIEGDKPYMVMEFVEGETLAQRMARYHRSGQLLPTDEVVRLFGHLCAAVDYAHKQGMLHRDLKPANVILNRQNDAILTDFGLAKITGVSGLTASGMVVGTPHYMSPEQAQGQSLDERSDVYSLSVMLYELLAGKLPFDADTPVAVIMQHITMPPPRIELSNPSVPQALAQVAMVGMSKKPEDRFRSAAAMGGALAAAMNPAPAPAAGVGTTPGVSTLGNQPVHTIPQPSPATPDPLATQRSDKPDLPTRRAPGAIPNGLPSTMQADAPPTEPTRQGLGIAPGGIGAPRKPTKSLGRFALIGIIVMLLAIGGGILVIALGNKGASQTTTNTAATTVGTLLFTDSDPTDFSHPANVITGAFTGLKQPASGSTYFAWLCDSGTSACTPLGAVSIQADGKASLSNSQMDSYLGKPNLTQQQLLTTLTFEITQEQTEASAPPAAPSQMVVYSGQIKAPVLIHIRHQITAFPIKPGNFANNTTALDTGLGNDALLLQHLNQQLQQAQATNNLTGMKLYAEQIFNLIGGKNGLQDLNGDGQINVAPGDDGFGMGTDAVVNPTTCSGSSDTANTTYLPLTMQHACLAAKASQSAVLMGLFTMIQTAGANLSNLLKNIAQLAQAIAQAKTTTDVAAQVNMLAGDAASVLSDQSEAKNQPGVSQILLSSEQMAAIPVSSV